MSAASTLTNQIIDRVYRSGGYAWRASSIGVYDAKIASFRASAKKGVADVLAVLPPAGRLVAIEIKIGKDRLSPEQTGFLENVTHAGGLSFVAHDLAGFEEWWYKTVCRQNTHA